MKSVLAIGETAAVLVTLAVAVIVAYRKLRVIWGAEATP